MGQLIWKNKLVVLWALQILNFLAVLLMPESSAAVNEQLGTSLGPLIAFYFFLTSLMMWLAIVVRPALSRWPMIVVGAFYAFVKVQWLVFALTDEMIAALFLTELWGLVAALMIVWYGWKAPKPEVGP